MFAPRLQEAAHVVDRLVVEQRHVQHAVGLGRDDVIDVSGRDDPGRRDARDLAGVATGLLVGVHVHADEVVERVLDDLAQRVHPGVTGRPLRDPVPLLLQCGHGMSADIPPSIGMTAPVMNGARSEARKQASSPTSSG